MSNPLRGLARNPALPPAALLRLAGDDRVSRWDLAARRAWTDEAFDALAAHPDPEVREALAQSPGATGDQRARLADDLSIRVVQAVLEGPPTRWAGPLPDWVYHRLAGHPEPLVRDLLTFLPGTPRDVVARLARDEQPGIADAARALLDRKSYEPPTLGRDEAVRFAADPADWNRERAAADPALPTEWIAVLAADPSPRVRLAVSARPELTEAQRAAIDHPVTPADAVPPLEWVLASGPAELDRCVRSAHPLLRRSAACHPDLPADLLAVLTADPDPAVRALLCAHQAHAPGELVLESYLATGDEDLLRHPAFPRTGLARLADDPAPPPRALVALDPDASPALIERLSHDPSGRVRSAMAADPRLPRPRLLELLADERTAEAAAANPALPAPVITRLLRAQGVR
ncbi:hypothetical protein Aph02nite_06280 [Actinoplanes philippinensis]|uniref:hypothetical protein n=1 Tax=Actinoplanes philippinensis TaxID=35752 RepID=UPI0019428A90|nr:hypothetical protein [Actinoplanes philippinensis]GIE74678.1 hypothetical protein Aph02nite_06280 [Actinoplanes philippinensis]